MGNERRQVPRISAETVRSLYVEVQTDGVMLPGAVVPEDVSPSGIRGRWERPLPEGMDFWLHLELPGKVRVKARVAWQRALPGSRGALAGLRFVRMAPGARERLSGWLATLSTPSRRRSVRVADLIPVEVIVAGGDESFSAIAADLGTEGMRLVNDFPLEDGMAIGLLLPLDWGPPVEVGARVRWCRESGGGGWNIGLEFDDVPGEARARLQAYIDLAG